MTTAFWVCATVTTISALTSLGFAGAAALTSTPETRTADRYAASRSIALASVAIVSFFNESRGWLIGIAVAMTIVQACDGVIGGLNHEAPKTYGPAFLATLNLAAVLWLLSS
jgi:hypothetical protein